MSQDFESAKAFLKKADGNGKTLYDHLTDVLLKIVKDKPENAIAEFEKLSVAVKESSLNPDQFKELPPFPQQSDARKALLAAIDRNANLIKPEKKKSGDGEEEEEEEEEKENVAIPDIVSDLSLFEHAGVSVSQEDALQVMLSVQKLANDESLESVRFWGKIFGTQKDYLIVEAKLAEYPEEENADPKFEPLGSGANEFIYYAANSVSGKWTRLPAVTPQQIITARQMRRFFTGDLNAPVLGFPRFLWGEAAYLRAQIARITAATVVSPKDFFQEDEEAEDGSLVENEEFAPLPPSELVSGENWSHHRKHILRQGRCVAYEEPEKDEDEEEEADEEEAEPEEPEEPPAPLSTLDADESKLKKLWRFRSAPGAGAGANAHAVASAESLSWPGAVSIAKGKSFASVYMGYGQKYIPTAYTPPPPPQVQAEYKSKFNPEEDETDPLLEQVDPLPPKDIPEEGKKAEGDEGDEEEEEDDD